MEKVYEDSNIGEVGGNEVLSDCVNSGVKGGLAGIVVGATLGILLAREMNGDYEIFRQSPEIIRYGLDFMASIGGGVIGGISGGVVGAWNTLRKYDSTDKT